MRTSSRIGKEKIVQLSGLSDQQVVRLYYDIDETDAPHVATTLEIDGLLWTGDEQLRDGLESKGFDHFFEPNRDG